MLPHQRCYLFISATASIRVATKINELLLNSDAKKYLILLTPGILKLAIN